MKIKTIIGGVLVGTLAAGFFTGCATRAKLQAEAKVSEADAQKTALAQVPGGTIKESELERENGKLVWSFEIATAGTKEISEVQVDALTGELVGVEKEK